MPSGRQVPFFSFCHPSILKKVFFEIQIQTQTPQSPEPHKTEKKKKKKTNETNGAYATAGEGDEGKAKKNDEFNK